MQIPTPEPAQWCINKLQGTDDYFLSVNTLYSEYCDDFDCSELSCENFEELLRSDKRLYVTPGAVTNTSSPQQEILGGMGLPSQTLVALTERRPSGKTLDSAIRAKAAHLQYALQKAWDARPTEGPRADEVEKKLLFLMEQAKKLCEMIGEAQNK